MIRCPERLEIDDLGDKCHPSHKTDLKRSADAYALQQHWRPLGGGGNKGGGNAPRIGEAALKLETAIEAGEDAGDELVALDTLLARLEA